MTTKIISTYIAAGYDLASQYSLLDITTTGGVGGYGVKLSATAKVENYGSILANGPANGVSASAAATIVNGSADDKRARISGYSGIFSPSAPATVTNFGTVEGLGSFGDGVFIEAGGTVTNGANGDAVPTIHGVFSGVASSVSGKVVNFGLISGTNGDGVYLEAGGSVTNGSVTDTRAEIFGPTGVASGGGDLTVVNFSTIRGYGGDDGVNSAGGGVVTNGAANDVSAMIYGDYSGIAEGASATITNFGSVMGLARDGVYLQAGGSVTNGAANDSVALIQGVYFGITTSFSNSAPTDVGNFGTIAGANYEGVILTGVGSVTNGSAQDTRALIESSYQAVNEETLGSTIVNFGTLLSYGAKNHASGATLAGGRVTNGSTADTAALIKGLTGVDFTFGTSTLSNFGFIEGEGFSGFGVAMAAGGSVTNGSASDLTAQIAGDKVGLYSAGPARVVNFATILSSETGDGGVQIQSGTVINGSSADTAAFIRGAYGVGVLGGAGTVTNFGAVIAMAGAGVDLAEGGVVTNGNSLTPAAMIDGYYFGTRVLGAGGTVNNFGTIVADTSFGAPHGIGVELTEGAITNGSAGDTTAVIRASFGVQIDTAATTTVTNFGTIDGTGGYAVLFAASTDTLVVESGSAFVGQVLGAGGVLDLASGVGTLSGLTAGNVTVTGSMARTTFQTFGTVEIGAGATFADAGAVTLAAGQVVDDMGTLSLGGAGANSIVSAGLIETTGALTLAGAVANTGTLEALTKGTLTVDGAVTGAGNVRISGGVADFVSTFTENVTFTSLGGVLELAKSQTFAGRISGFAKTPVSSLDLLDIAFGTKTKATFSGTTTSGILTVTDGTHTSKITLLGNYTTSTFTTASDGHGGTTVTDPPKAPVAGPPPMAPLITAMAGFGSGGAAMVVHGPDIRRTASTFLAMPRTVDA